jgi:hypothetical protein
MGGNSVKKKKSEEKDEIPYINIKRKSGGNRGYALISEGQWRVRVLLGYFSDSHALMIASCTAKPVIWGWAYGGTCPWGMDGWVYV